MKREDAAIIIRAILIGLFSIAIIALSCALFAFWCCAKRVYSEMPM